MEKLPQLCIYLSISFACRDKEDIINLSESNSLFHHIIHEDEFFSLDLVKIAKSQVKRNTKQQFDNISELFRNNLTVTLNNLESFFSIPAQIKSSLEKVMDACEKNFSGLIPNLVETMDPENFIKLVPYLEKKGIDFKNGNSFRNTFLRIYGNNFFNDSYEDDFESKMEQNPYLYIKYKDQEKFEEPTQKLIDYLKTIEGGIITGSFPISMLNKDFKAQDIDIFFNKKYFYEKALPKEIEHNVEFQTEYDNIYLIREISCFQYEGYKIQFILIDDYIETIDYINANFDFDCSKLIWDPNLEDPFSKNSKNRIQRTKDKIALYNTNMVQYVRKRQMKYILKGFKIIPIDWINPIKTPAEIHAEKEKNMEIQMAEARYE